MNRTMSLGTWLVVLLVAAAGSRLLAQDAAKPASPPATNANIQQPAPKPLPTKSPYRRLAPGVLISVDPMRKLEETVSRHDIVALLAADPKFDWAKDIAFRRDVWVLKFEFKPVRLIEVDVPQPSGFMQRKLIWYMVYVVTNTGKVMHPVEDAKLPYPTAENRLLFDVKTVDFPVRFTPEFVLEGHQHMKDDQGFTKAYPDRVIPVAMDAIRRREDPKRKFLTSVEMCRELAVGESAWGIATWEDIDPRIVRFSVYVFGLTNAYRWRDDPGQYKPGESPLQARKRYQKALKLNFWRPGDPYYEHEKEIRFGIPGGVDYEWVYR